MKHKEYIVCFLVFIFLVVLGENTNAQTASGSTNQQPTKTSTSIKENKEGVSNATIQGNTNSGTNLNQSGKSGDPYLNYKGISDPKEAKEAWITDHPEEYKKMTSPPKENGTAIPNDNSSIKTKDKSK